MEKNILLFLLSLVSYSAGDLLPEVEIEMLMDRVNSYDQYAYRRYLDTEKKTCDLYRTVVHSLQLTMETELNILASGLTNQIFMASIMTKTPTYDKCLNLVEEQLQDFISQEVESFVTSTNGLLSEIEELQVTLNKDEEEYGLDKERVLTGIDSCGVTYADKTQAAKRNECTKRLDEYFFKHNRNIALKHKESPCMTHFMTKALPRITASAENVQDEVDHLTSALQGCGRFNRRLMQLTNNSEKLHYLNQKSTLADQITYSQKKYNDLNNDIEALLKHYYDLEKAAKSVYDIEAKTRKFFRPAIEAVMKPYVEAINETHFYAKKQEQIDCGSDAKANIHKLICQGTKHSVECDKEVVESTTQSMWDVRELFSQLTGELQQLGNVAILDCLNQGYFLGRNMVRVCYDLKMRGFNLTRTTTIDDIKEIVEQLENYNITYFNHSERPLPCGDSETDWLLWKADLVLHDYKRCLYRTTGDDYDVTTPVYDVTTQVTFPVVEEAMVEEGGIIPDK